MQLRDLESAMDQLRQRGLALGEAPQQLVDRLGEYIRRHEGAQQRLDAWMEVGSHEQVGAYMRATRQVLALAVRMVVSRVDLSLQGESSIADASIAHDSFMAQPRNNLPFDLVRTIDLEEIRQLAIDAEEVVLQCIPVEQASSPSGAEQPSVP